MHLVAMTLVYNEMVVGVGVRRGATDAMSELPDVRNMLVAAEQAATAGDFESANELLRGAARLQEAELGPLHPDLANTLNNLAIVAEKAGRPGDAEIFYRRAVAIASASLPADHPMVAASRQNLEDFCRSCGLPIDPPAVMALTAEDAERRLHVSTRSDATGETKISTDVRTVTRPPAPTASHPLPPAARRSSRLLASVAIGVFILMTAALLVRRPWSSRETSPSIQTAPKVPEIVEPALPGPAMPAPIAAAQPPKVAPGDRDRDVITDNPPAPRDTSGAITLATIQLCRTLSTSGSSWRCDPAGASVAPGPMILYTRVRSLGDAAVVHRWYRGDTLRQSVKLTIRSNTTEGYRTYSRQTVDSGENWRVEVRSTAGDLLHEQRFAVR